MSSHYVLSLKQEKVDSKRLLLLHYDTDQLPPITATNQSENGRTSSPEMGKHRIIDFSDDEQYRAFRLLFETLQVETICTPLFGPQNRIAIPTLHCL